MDLYDENRYRKRRVANRFTSIVSKLVVTSILIVVAIIVIRACLPWLKTLWDTVQ